MNINMTKNNYLLRRSGRKGLEGKDWKGLTEMFHQHKGGCLQSLQMHLVMGGSSMVLP